MVVLEWHIIVIGCLISALSQLSKIYILLDGHPETTANYVWAKMLAGAIAYLSFAYTTITMVDDVPFQLLLGLAGVVGWLGGDVMAALGKVIQARLGIPLAGPEEPKDRDKGK